MGLIQAAAGSFSGVLADQWKEFFYCDALNDDTLMVKGQKKTTSRTTNTKGNDNIISNGSIVAVADGQCMIIVEQGAIVEVSAQPGEYVFDSSTEPSIFAGSLGEGIVGSFQTFMKRVGFGGDTAKDQRVYYFNTKEIKDNKFGTSNPFMFRVVDKNINLDRDVSVRCNGIYSYKLTDPILFYKNVCGNVTDIYRRSEIDNQLKTEFIGALQPAFAKLSDLELRPSQIPAHAAELEDAMNEVLTKKWSENRGITVASVAMNPITLKEEDLAKIQQLQDAAVLSNPNMAGGLLAGSMAEALPEAAGNAAGAMTGFMGMGMAMNSTGMNPASLFAMGQQQQAQTPQAAPAPAAAPANAWTCACGTVNTAKFCSECGAKNPSEGWICACGALNKGKFCSECGAKKPDGALQYKCDKCGWEPEDPTKPPKFCPECGDPFGDEDIVK